MLDLNSCAMETHEAKTSPRESKSILIHLPALVDAAKTDACHHMSVVKISPGVGHDIGQYEASILNEFLRQHASDAYFEVEGLEWDELDFQLKLDVGPPIPGINA